jgi:micrococcal nuclease
VLRRACIPFVLVALAGCGAGEDASRTEPGMAQVLGVVDGDTVLVQIGGRRERVRYIGIDTPESVRPGAPVQCFAKRASGFNERLVADESVRLVADAERRDRHGRLLAYVYRVRDGLFVNAELVRRGYARTLTIPPNVAHAEELRRLAALARRNGRGLWSSCPAS